MKLKELLKSPEILIALVTGVCLIGKVWLIRRILGQEIEVLDLLIPVLIPTIYSGLKGLTKDNEKVKNSIWLRAWFWIVIIIISTLLSLYPWINL